MRPYECQFPAQDRVSLQAILFFAQEAAGRHCALLGADRDALGEKNLFWAVIRQKAEVLRLPEQEPVTVKTWPMPTTRTAYPRATAGYDREGNLLFRVHSLWVLMDRKSRAMVLPGKSGVIVEGFLTGEEVDAPGGIAQKSLEQAGVRRVEQEDLDENGHMNNTRYLLWAEELLAREGEDRTPRGFTVCYFSEAKLGEKLQLQMGFIGPKTAQIQGLRERADQSGKSERVFAVTVDF